MIQRAVVQGWSVPDHQRQKAEKLINEVVSDPNSTPREILAAARLAVQMEAANLRDEETATTELTKDETDSRRRE